MFTIKKQKMLWSSFSTIFSTDLTLMSYDSTLILCLEPLVISQKVTLVLQWAAS